MSDWGSPHQHRADDEQQWDARELIKRMGVVDGCVKEVWLTPEEDEKVATTGVDRATGEIDDGPLSNTEMRSARGL